MAPRILITDSVILNGGDAAIVLSMAGSLRRELEAGIEDCKRVVDVLAGKAVAAAKREGIPRLVLSGGVSANSRLRELALSRGAAAGVEVFLPSKALCTDNAAMVALLGERRMSAGSTSGPEVNAYAASRFTR